MRRHETGDETTDRDIRHERQAAGDRPLLHRVDEPEPFDLIQAFETRCPGQEPADVPPPTVEHRAPLAWIGDGRPEVGRTVGMRITHAGANRERRGDGWLDHKS